MLKHISTNTNNFRISSELICSNAYSLSWRYYNKIRTSIRSLVETALKLNQVIVINRCNCAAATGYCGLVVEFENGTERLLIKQCSVGVLE